MSQTTTQQPTNPFSTLRGPFAGVSHGTQAWSNTTLPQGAVPINSHRRGILSQRGLSTAWKPSTAFPGTGHRLNATFDGDQKTTSMPIDGSGCDVFMPHDDRPHDARQTDHGSSRGDVRISAGHPSAKSMRTAVPASHIEDHGHEGLTGREHVRFKVHWEDERYGSEESSSDSDEGVRIIVKLPCDNIRRSDSASRMGPQMTGADRTARGSQHFGQSHGLTSSDRKIADLEADLQSAKSSLFAARAAVDELSAGRDADRNIIDGQRETISKWEKLYESTEHALELSDERLRIARDIAIQKWVDLKTAETRLTFAEEQLDTYRDKVGWYRSGQQANVPMLVDQRIWKEAGQSSAQRANATMGGY